MALNALREAGIPHFAREETSGGLKLAFPAAPAPGPGIWWTLLVPADSVADAKEILLKLPCGAKTKAGVWDFGPTKNVKRRWKIYAVVIILITLAIIFVVRNNSRTHR